jgi:aspartate kinase
MKKDIRVIDLTISSIEDLKRYTPLSNQGEDVVHLLMVDESFGLKNNLKHIVEVYFNNQEEALQMFLTYKNTLIAESFELETLSSDMHDELEDLFVDAIWLLEDEPHDSFEYVHDQIVALGLMFISKILHYNLLKKSYKSLWVDNRDFILTNDSYSDAEINMEVSRSKWFKILENMDSKVNIIIVQNRVGSTFDNNTTILGNNGNIHSIFS